jgi:probable rRNA maturation factor
MVINRQRRVSIALSGLDEFLTRVSRELGMRRKEFTVCLVTNAQIAKWNLAYRGKAKPTDVLSFPMEHNGSARDASSPVARKNGTRAAGSRVLMVKKDSYKGDIAIAPAIARENARRLGRTLDQELRVLVLHGVLHLLGYDHETDNGRMDRIEKRMRRRLRLL